MNPTDDFDHDVSAWFHADAERRVPPHLDAVLRRTRSERQRPVWSSLERWLPIMGISTTYRSRVAAHRSLVVLAVVALLIAALGAVAVSGSFRPAKDIRAVAPTVTASPSIIGSPSPSASPVLASSGRIYVGTAAGITSFAADGSDSRSIVELPGGATGLAVSPDGRRLSYLEGPEPGLIRVLTLASGDVLTVPKPAGMLGGDPVSWSPGSDEIAFSTFQAGKEYLYTAKIDGSPATRLGGDLIDETMAIWFPSYSPDGASIAFIGVAGGAGQDPRPGDAYIASRDGSTIRKVAEGIDVSPGGTLGWSPDPDVQQLLLVRNGVQVLDVETGRFTDVGLEFWPSWSPDGERIAAWADGLAVVRLDDVPALSDEVVHPFGAISGYCQDNAGLVGQAVCGPVAWSSDGAYLFGPDILDTGIVVLHSDRVGDAVLLPNTGGAEAAVWVPTRP